MLYCVKAFIYILNLVFKALIMFLECCHLHLVTGSKPLNTGSVTITYRICKRFNQVYELHMCSDATYTYDPMPLLGINIVTETVSRHCIEWVMPLVYCIMVVKTEIPEYRNHHPMINPVTDQIILFFWVLSLRRLIDGRRHTLMSLHGTKTPKDSIIILTAVKTSSNRPICTSQLSKQACQKIKRHFYLPTWHNK
jgi:hypothetical protein